MASLAYGVVFPSDLQRHLPRLWLVGLAAFPLKTLPLGKLAMAFSILVDEICARLRIVLSPCSFSVEIFAFPGISA